MVGTVKLRLAALAVLLAAAGACTDSDSGRSEDAYCHQWKDFTEQARSPFDLAMNDGVFGDLSDVAPDEVRSHLDNIVDAIKTINDIGELPDNADEELTARYDDAITVTGTDYPIVADYTATTCYGEPSAMELRTKNDVAEIRDNLVVCEEDQKLNRIVSDVLDEQVDPAIGFRELAEGWRDVAEQIPERPGALIRPMVESVATEYAKIAIVFEDYPDASFTSEPEGVPDRAVQQVQASLTAIDETFEVLVGNDACEVHSEVIAVFDETGELVVPSVPTEN